MIDFTYPCATYLVELGAVGRPPSRVALAVNIYHKTKRRYRSRCRHRVGVNRVGWWCLAWRVVVLWSTGCWNLLTGRISSELGSNWECKTVTCGRWKFYKDKSCLNPPWSSSEPIVGRCPYTRVSPPVHHPGTSSGAMARHGERGPGYGVRNLENNSTKSLHVQTQL